MHFKVRKYAFICDKIKKNIHFKYAQTKRFYLKKTFSLLKTAQNIANSNITASLLRLKKINY